METGRQNSFLYEFPDLSIENLFIPSIIPILEFFENDYTMDDYFNLFDYALANYIHHEELFQQFVTALNNVNSTHHFPDLELAIAFLKHDIFEKSKKQLQQDLEEVYYDMIIMGHSPDWVTFWKSKIIYYRTLRQFQVNNCEEARECLMELINNAYLINNFQFINQVWGLISVDKIMTYDVISADWIVDTILNNLDIINDEYFTATAYKYKASTLSKFGNYIEANEYYKQAITLYRKHQLFIPEIATRRNMALNYYELGEFEIAREICEQILYVDKEIKIVRQLASDYFVLYFIYLELGEITKQKIVNRKLEEISKQYRDVWPNLEFLSAIVTALTCKNEKDIHNMALAIKKLDKLYKREDMRFIYSQYGLFYYGEILLEEWRIFRNEKTKRKILDVISDLIEIGRGTKLVSFKIKGFILKSRLNLYRGDIEESLQVIQQAEQAASTGIIRLNQLAMKDHDNLKKKILDLEEQYNGSRKFLSQLDKLSQESEQIAPIMGLHDILTPDEVEKFRHLTSFQLFVQPTRFAILFLLSKYNSLISSDLRKFLDISWGNYSTHLKALLEEEMVEYNDQFIDGKICKVISLTNKGMKLIADFYNYISN